MFFGGGPAQSNLADAKTPTVKELLQRQIDATEQQIDRLVYELYEVTQEEIRIAEQGDESDGRNTS